MDPLCNVCALMGCILSTQPQGLIGDIDSIHRKAQTCQIATVATSSTRNIEGNTTRCTELRLISRQVGTRMTALRISALQISRVPTRTIGFCHCLISPRLPDLSPLGRDRRIYDSIPDLRHCEYAARQLA